MTFNRSALLLISVLALTSACTKSDSSKAKEQVNAVSAQKAEGTNPTLSVVVEKNGNEEVRNVQLSFPLGGGASTTYKGELKADSEISLKSSLETDESTVTGLAYGKGLELVVAVRETPTDAHGLVHTAFLFVKKPNAQEYSFLDRRDSTTVSQAKTIYGDLAKDEEGFQSWYVEALKKVNTPADAPKVDDGAKGDDKGEDKGEDKGTEDKKAEPQVPQTPQVPQEEPKAEPKSQQSQQSKQSQTQAPKKTK